MKQSNLLIFISFLGVIASILGYKIKREFDTTHLFSGNNNRFISRFRKILEAFLFGFKISLKKRLQIDSIEKLIESNLPVFYRGFAYEGVSMATSIFSFFRKENMNRLMNRKEAFIYQLFVGYGWALHTLFGYYTKPYHFFSKRMDSKYFPVVYDGVGFKVGLFQYKKNKDVIKGFYSYDQKNERAYFQGFGRSLWFISEFNLDLSIKLATEISTKYSRDIISGIGIAYSYSLFDEIATNIKKLNIIPEGYNKAFLQGIAFGIYARIKQHREYAQKVLKQLEMKEQFLIQNWVNLIDQTALDLDRTLPQKIKNEYFYFLWIDKIRDKIRL